MMYVRGERTVDGTTIVQRAFGKEISYRDSHLVIQGIKKVDGGYNNDRKIIISYGNYDRIYIDEHYLEENYTEEQDIFST